MKTIRSLTASILILCMALSLSACSGAGNGAFPDGFDKYVSLLGLHEESILDELGVTEADLMQSPGRQNRYALAEPVVFHGLSFTQIFTCFENDRAMDSFEYHLNLTGDSKTNAESILALAKKMTNYLGVPYDDGAEGNDSFLYQMTVEELEAWLTAGMSDSLSDRWPLGKLLNKQIMARYALYESMSFDTNLYYFTQDHPTLVATLNVYTDGAGFAAIYLSYGLNYRNIWE